MKKRKVTILLDNEIYTDFQKFCEENALIISKKIELLIKVYMEKNKEKK